MPSEDASALLKGEAGSLDHAPHRFVYILANAVADLAGIDLKVLLMECFPIALETACGTTEAVVRARFDAKLFDVKVRSALRATGAVFKSDLV
jgi:hypothetical protein